MKNMKKILIVCVALGFTLLYAQNIQDIDDDKIDEAYIDKELHALIYGVDCGDSTKIAPQKSLPKNTINAGNNSTIDTTKYTDAKTRSIAFNGIVLNGGIFDNRENLYLSANRKISYNLIESNTLEIKAICEKQSFKISNFSNGDFGLYLSHNPTKEVAIALNINTSMSGYIEAFKEIAPFVAKHILGDREKQYAKISLVIFTEHTIQTLGTFYNAQDFADAFMAIKGKNSPTKMINVALIESMRNFTKDNGLRKEIYLITDGKPDDMTRSQKMLTLTKNLNANITKNTASNADNRVKIHTFALSPNLEFLKNIAKITGGSYNEVNNTYDFKKKILTLSNDGKPFDKSELGNEIRPSKNHKIYDPNNPDDSNNSNDNPPSKKGKR